MLIKFSTDADDPDPIFIETAHIFSLRRHYNGVMLRTVGGVVLTLENCDLDQIATTLGWTGALLCVADYATPPVAQELVD